ncbi:MAG: nucleotidyltransferase domain-containing protein [Candidatus Taylorbacteria bacterium]|nr:nucleotidyltransferase domain-containing protein [Candidatus Taylorbacteria bacterium]
MNIDEYKPAIETVAQKYGLDFAVLFGSQARGRIHGKSDVDIAVISRGPVDRARLAMDLAEIFKCGDTEVVNLANASPTLMHSVSRDGKLLYEKKRGAYLTWRVYAAKIWMDTEWLRRLRGRKLTEWSDAYAKAQS